MEIERENASYLNLRLEPCSDEAQAFVCKVSSQTWASSDSKRPRPSKLHEEATGAFIADLLTCHAQDPSKCLYRSMMASSFTGERIGYRAFRRLVEGSVSAKLVSVVGGTGGGNEIGLATRFKATVSLISLADKCGIDLEKLDTHFRPIPRPSRIAYPLLLRGASRQVGCKKEQGRNIPVDYGKPEAAALAEQVNDLNTFFADIQIEPASDHLAFHRIFNEGDTRGFAWNKGGRLYSMGNSYQQRKHAVRSCMKLEGEAVVEIDIRASHLTILHAKLGQAFDPSSRDPYSHPAIPREVLKGWVAMTLGHDRFHRAWTKDKKADYHNETGRDLRKDFPIKGVREEALKLHPVLRGWPTCDVRWGDLQFIESCAVIDTVHQLAREPRLPALPVHDSIIVPVSKRELACSVLKANFKKHVGVEPALSIR
ncbi:hypothetical protein GRI34_02845 [Erythrobacter aquimaris]|uniref:DNA-directed DNA polymerase family A palm domain-containing protein n=1 Tax=Qipengyuania aquimaris TaxID=255984 RepID=A0A6I4TJP7_9SPHN|nr:hypothetical protein [Qipengyuania aquimaris]MXO95357.1 hypothetical protein [Qipengyuania aquimaris]